MNPLVFRYIGDNLKRFELGVIGLGLLGHLNAVGAQVRAVDVVGMLVLLVLKWDLIEVLEVRMVLVSVLLLLLVSGRHSIE